MVNITHLLSMVSRQKLAKPQRRAENAGYSYAAALHHTVHILVKRRSVLAKERRE
jgi:F0F1-type ATP synthase gamma subunit